MFKLVKLSFLSLSLLLVVGCGSTKSQPTVDASNDTAMENAHDVAERKIKTAKINAQLGIAYLEKGDVRRAKQKLLLALDQGPNIPEPLYSMAYFLEATGNKPEAQTYYLKAIAISHNGEAENNYGTFLCRSGRYKEAIQHFMVAARNPDYLTPADAYENAGLCALHIPNKALARTYFSYAIMHDPARPTSITKLDQLEHAAPTSLASASSGFENET